MGSIRKPRLVKLIIGFIFKDETVLRKAESILKRHFGEVDFESKVLPFIHTDYYEKEFGTGLSRKFIVFKRLIPPETLARIKIFTNKIEEKYSRESSRVINIDPGYVDLAKLVLASTKDFAHRIYLGSGIYAEVTLSYHDKAFNAKEWTYPDYKTPEYLKIFESIRESYSKQINK